MRGVVLAGFPQFSRIAHTHIGTCMHAHGSMHTEQIFAVSLIVSASSQTSFRPDQKKSASKKTIKPVSLWLVDVAENALAGHVITG